MKKIAILLEDLFDEKELIYPYYKLQENYVVRLLGSEPGKVYKGKNGLPMKSDGSTKEAVAEEFAGVLIPGGFSPDYMRRVEDTINFVKEIDRQSKPIAAICHGPWMIISSKNVEGLNMTSFPSIKDDIINAGAKYKDEEVVVDENLITSRTPDDLVPFVREFIKQVESI